MVSSNEKNTYQENAIEIIDIVPYFKWNQIYKHKIFRVLFQNIFQLIFSIFTKQHLLGLYIVLHIYLKHYQQSRRICFLWVSAVNNSNEPDKQL